MLGISKFKKASDALAFLKMKKDYFCTVIASMMNKGVSLTDILRGVLVGLAGMAGGGCGRV